MRFECLVILVLALLLSGCNRSAPETAVSQPTPAASPIPTSTPLNDFEEALRFVKNGQFTYIWVFTRKDGKPFDSEDGAIIRAKASQIVDRAMTKDGKKFVAGSNFPWEEQNLVELQKRYVIEDYSAR
ncbi:MAG TPA: hypothetical protein VFY51_02610 [Pyrinomonadaceae bacterium]|nr:hypothetical protein [Pyrinomonadaceae bacterium]